ncbi:uncharacterized protein LOC129723317 [Wyeomyia smithii]|uniref:uncharacterized protein LOC129723317 n=1 Tax=Wyeomyia smithii TaxID=174621 RepID=UPI002467ACA9|nr:uncharacterized protein LOC129723317 [Wyeomyia smithii]
MFALLLMIIAVLSASYSAPTGNDTGDTLANIERSLETSRNIHTAIQPFDLSSLQSITFSPNHHQLAVQNLSTVFNNGSVEIVKVTVTPDNATTEASTKTDKLKLSTVTEVNTSSATVSTASTATVTVTPTTNIGSINFSTTKSNLDVIVLNGSGEDIAVKINEVAADPVILSVVV